MISKKNHRTVLYGLKHNTNFKDSLFVAMTWTLWAKAKAYNKRFGSKKTIKQKQIALAFA